MLKLGLLKSLMSPGYTPASAILTMQWSVGTARSPNKLNRCSLRLNICALLCLCHALGVPLAGSTHPSDIGSPRGSFLALCPLSTPTDFSDICLLLPLKSIPSNCWQTHAPNCSQTLPFGCVITIMMIMTPHVLSLQYGETYIVFTDPVWVPHVY